MLRAELPTLSTDTEAFLTASTSWDGERQDETAETHVYSLQHFQIMLYLFLFLAGVFNAVNARINTAGMQRVV